MSLLPSETPGPAATSGKSIKNAIQQTSTAAAEEVLKEKNSEASNVLNKAQQAFSLVSNIPGVAPPGLKGVNGISGQVAFEQLSTSEATQVAMANTGISPSPGLSAIGSDLSVPCIAARVSINGQPIDEVLSLEIHQDVGEHNRLLLRFFHDQVQPPGSMLIDGAEKLLGQVAEVELYDSNGIDQAKLQHLFVVADVALEQDTLNEGVLQVTGYAPTWLLDGQPHFEVFYKKSLTTIVKECTSRSLAQVKATLKADPTLSDTLPFVCRYNESAWNFLKRLSVETGQWLYFNGKELVFGKPEAQSGADIRYGQNCSRISMSLKVRPVQQGLFDYEADTHRPIRAAANNYNGNAGAYNNIAFEKSKELFGTIPSVCSPGLLPARQETLEAVGKGKSAQSAAGMYYVTGETTIYDLRVGLNVSVDLKRKDQTASHTPVRIISIEHHWDITGQYYNRFTAIPAAAEVPPPMPYQRPLTHPVLANVIDNDDSQGRVRVQFMGWQQENGIPETGFIRVLTPDAGGAGDKVATNRGLVTIPEVGDQVYIDFEGGNPDRPFVTGSVFHGKVGTGGGQTNKTKSLTTRSGCAVILDDSKGSVKVKDPSGNILTMHGNGKVTLTAPNAFTINTTDFIVNAGNSITLNAQPGENGSGEGLFTISAKKDINATSDTESITLTATLKDIVLNALESNIELKAMLKDIILSAATGNMNITAGTQIMTTSPDTQIF